ncbi:MAG: ATP-binding protein [Parcubacteria group bacterium]|jgi:hypothetical protein
MEVVEIYEKLKAGKTEEIIGLEESAFFDVKSGIYDISKKEGKFELAKDVCSFANSGGGLIAIGFETAQEKTSMKERISAVNPIDKNIVNLDSYRKILLEMVYPKISNHIEIGHIDCNGSKQGIIVYIYIKNDCEKDKPFIVTKAVEDSNNGGQKLSTKFIALPTRQGSDTDFETAEQIQKALKWGLKVEPSFDNIFQELKIISDKLSDGQSNAKVSDKDIAEKEQKRIDGIRNDFFKDLPCLIMSAIFSPQPVEVKDIFNPSAGPMGLIERPPSIRPRFGWNLETLDMPKIKEGRYLEVTNGERKIIRIYRDGHIIFGGQMDEHFLGHGTKSRVEGDAVNAIGVTEIVDEFARFCEMLRVFLKNKPEKVKIKLAVCNPQKAEIQIMSSVPVNGFRFHETQGKFDSEYQDVEKTFNVSAGLDYDASAYELVSEFFHLFGLSDDKLIFVKEENGIKKIDVEAFKKI